MPELGDDATPAVQADPELIAAVPLARGALAEITPESTIGEPLGYEVEESGAVSLFFECRIPGYPGWHWTVTVGRAGDDAEPTVLEAELMPGDGALLAPDWVPWSDRLADYQAAQEAHAVPGAEGDDDDDEDDVDEDEDDGFDDSEDDRDVHDLHDDGDLDGVDIDSVDVGFDEETDIDTGLDLEAEEAAALAAPADEDATDEDATDEDAADEDVPDEDAADEDASDEDAAEEDATEEDATDEDVPDEDAPDSRRTSAAPRHRQVTEPEHSEDESDDDGADPGAPVADAERDADDHDDDEGEQPER
jgi:hypothetical protein